MGLFEGLLLLFFVGTTSVARKLHFTVTVKEGGDVSGLSESPSPPPPPPQERSHMAPFNPSIAVVVGLLTTMFSITFLLLLYAVHCKRDAYTSASRVPPSAAARKNSGVHRTVIESLPIFRFGSLRGEKDGLECAVCLNRFESTEVLRLLPKCKHAFHMECVDTWLDAHSTCPLCRYRVDPEDILLIGDDARILGQNEPLPPSPPLCEESQRLESLRRVSGRHSSAGERAVQVVLQKPTDSSENHRDSGDNSRSLTTRRSLDSSNMKSKKRSGIASVGCFDRQIRKDGSLLTAEDPRASSDRRRLEHRIIIGDAASQHRWSDVQPSDLLYLRSEMIMSESRRFLAASGSRPSMSRLQKNHNEEGQSGRSVINGRSVSEITGLSRFTSSNNNHHNRQQQHHQQRQQRWWKREEREEQRRQAGVVSRWVAWISQSPPSQRQQTQKQPAVTSELLEPP